MRSVEWGMMGGARGRNKGCEVMDGWGKERCGVMRSR
jgi:hypothetical protein